MFSCCNIICLFIFFHRAAFNSLDKNSDGTIDFNEFLFFVAVSSGSGHLDERLDLIFDLYVIQFFERVIK
jgi:Ca2+-binding EF-hand superfamily protein